MKSAFKNHKKLIQKIAHKYSRSTGIEFEELEAEGNKIFVEAYLAYTPERSKFSTFLYCWLQNGLTNYTDHQRSISQHEAGSFEDLMDSAIGNPAKQKIFSRKDSTEKEILFSEELEKLSPDARILSDMIFQGELIRRSEKTKKLLSIGWNRNRIFRAQREIKTFLKAVKYEIC